MTIKFPGKHRTLKTQLRNHFQPLGTGFHVLPAIIVNNWFPRYPYYHVSFKWLCWTWDVWWLNYA